MLKNPVNTFSFDFSGQEAVGRKVIIAAILAVALIAFEIFNFDTTQFALANLMGEIRFAGIMWATILAIAFCAIDFAGLVRIITPERGIEEPRTTWFLMGAWFLGTIANSTLTWWAVSVSLLSHDFGNEVLSRATLLRYVPIFVAMLVWLTRILFIGALSATGEDLFDRSRKNNRRGLPSEAPLAKANRQTTVPGPMPAQPVRESGRNAIAPPSQAARSDSATRNSPRHSQPTPPAHAADVTYEPIDDPFEDMPMPSTSHTGSGRPASRIQNRPPTPGAMRTNPVQARPMNNRR